MRSSLRRSTKRPQSVDEISEAFGVGDEVGGGAKANAAAAAAAADAFMQSLGGPMSQGDEDGE